MKHTRKVVLVGLGVLLAASVALLVWTRMGEEDGRCGRQGVAWSDDCKSVKEEEEDPEVPTPHSPPFFVGMSSSGGTPFGANAWYRTRLVEEETGRYGGFGPWSKSPIIAGGKNPPCSEKDCEETVTGAKTCDANLVRIGTNERVPEGFALNVHRFVRGGKDVRPPGKEDGGRLVGMMFRQGRTGWRMVDTSPSPCDEVDCSRPEC